MGAEFVKDKFGKTQEYFVYFKFSNCTVAAKDLPQKAKNEAVRNNTASFCN